MRVAAPVFRATYDLAVPGGLLVALSVLALPLAPAAPPWASLITAVPYFALACGVLLGARFNQGRLVLGVLTLAAADHALMTFGASPVVAAAVATLLPLNLLTLAFVGERGIVSLRTVGLGAALLAQGAGVALALRPEHRSWARVLDSRWVGSDWTAWTAVPQAALLVFALGFTLVGVRFLVGRGALHAGYLWALVASLLALHDPGWRTTYFATAQLVLCLAVIEKSHAMAYRDPLTGLPARRALDEALERLDGRYTVAMLDLDHFKKLNDRHGHEVGDQVLRMVASRLARVTGGGCAYRFGGEEFTVIFRGKGSAEALPHLERLRAGVAASPFIVRGAKRPRKRPTKPRKGASVGSDRLRVTLSVGVAERDCSATAGEVLRAADRALYKAKGAGRNRVLAA